VASTAFVPSAAGPLQARELSRRLEWLRIAVPAETRLAQSQSGAPARANEQPIQFDVPAGSLSSVVAAIERISAARVVMSDPSIASIWSAGVSGLLTPREAIARVLEGTSVTMRSTGDDSVVLEIRLAAEQVEVSAPNPLPRPSSPKYTQPLIDVPQTVEVISREVMDAQNVTTLSDALRNVPGISLQAGEGGGASNTSGDMFNLRGFSANNSLFVDGVRDDGLISRDVFNIEQVEVFMGPTGADIGRGNAAGYVNMQTKAPHEGSHYEVKYGYGSENRNRATVDVNHAFNTGSDSWISRSAIRLNALWEDGGVQGRHVVAHENKALAPTVALGLGTSTRVTVGAQITRQENVPDYGLPTAAWTEDQLAPAVVHAEQPVDLQNFYGSVGYDFDDVEQDTYTALVDRDINARLTLRNQTRYNDTHRTAVITTLQNPASFVPETQTVALSRQGNERKNTILSNQTSLSGGFSTGSLRHQANGGIEIGSEEQFAPALVGVGTRAPASIYAPNPFAPVVDFAPQRGLAFTNGKTATVGVYAFDTVEVGQRWQFSGGLRWERYTTEFEAASAAGDVTSDLSVSDSYVTGKAGVLFRFTSTANAYFGYGTSVAPPGTANFTLNSQPNNQNNPNVDPQESTNYEIGTKVGLFNSRLTLNAALFRTDNKNVIYTVDATAVPPLYNQDDAQRVEGVTVGAVGALSPRWQILASLGYLDAKQISQNPLNDGNRMVLTPEWSGSVWTSYAFPARLTLGGGVRFLDDVFVNTANTIFVPPYSLVDAMAEYSVNRNLSLRLNITNITDVQYVKNVNNNGGRFNPGTPRAAAFTSVISF
jgi:catecholate siderophore receptor